MVKTERRTRTKRAIYVVVALLLVAYLISSTYARYSTQALATGKAQIAKWAVTMKSGDTTLTSTTQDITFTVQSNPDVVPTKIAPAVTAIADIELDLTGTEVGVDFTATVGSITPSNLPSSDKISLTSAIVEGGNVGSANYIPLVNNAAFTSSNGKKTVRLTLTWENDDNNNPDDTSTGEAAGTITVPVTLKLLLHLI